MFIRILVHFNLENFYLFMKKHILRFRSLLLLLIAWIGMNSALMAQVSVTATAGTTGPTTYATVNAAFAAINSGTHQGEILITVTANTTEPATAVQLLSSGVGSSSYQSVKIVPSGNVTINSAATPTASRAILEFIGADSVTIDGDDPATPGARNLTIQMATTTTAGTACIRFSSSSTTADGCRNATVRNCNIVGGRPSAVATTVSYGIFSGLSSAAATITTGSGAADNDSMLLENNSIQRCYYGIYAFGIATAYVMDNLVIRNNLIGSNVQANNVGFRGIYVANTQIAASPNSVLIEGNDIQGGDTLTGLGTSIAGLDLNVSNAGAIVRNNNIHNVENPSTGGWGSYGIFISSPTNNSNIHIYNNFIRDIRAFHYTSSFSTFTNYGIFSSSAVSNIRINNNTIALQKLNNGSGTANFSACVALSSTTATLAEFRNNILVNLQSDNTGQACNGVYLGSTAPLTAGAMNNNAYFMTGSTGHVGRIGTVNHATLAAWRTATSRDSNSFFVAPSFTSATDLHLTTAKSLLESNGLTIAGITTDYDGQTRPGPVGSVNGGGLNFDIGADEADMAPDVFGYDSASVSQITGNVPAGTSDNAVLRIAVYVSGSVGTPVSLTNMYINTIGTTAAADISAAKLYYTGNSAVFNVTNQFGSTVTSPSGAFNITGTQNLAAGVNYFWLSYDIASTAANANLLDARVDSFVVAGLGRIPANNNPTGALQVALPMTYVGSNSEHVDLTKVETGSINNRLLRVMVRMSSTGAPVNLTQINLNTNGGGDDTSNISNIKVYYTAGSPNFAATNQFGSTFIQTTPTGSSWGAFNINGIRTLQNDTNYFWVTYDIKAAAIVGDSVDAECTSLTINGTSYTPSTTAPAGNRQIRAPYCTSAAQFAGDGEIWNVTIGSLNNTSNCASVVTGPGSTLSLYSNYTTSVAPANLVAGLNIPFSVNTSTCGGNYNGVLGIWIDLNQDGDFNDAGENVHMSPSFMYGTTVFRTGTISIPCTASPGLTRMRVILNETTVSPIPVCGTYGYGETEDYMVNIVNAAPVFNAANTVQISGTTSPGATNVSVLRVPIKVTSSSCSPGTLNEIKFSTTGTTTNADIVSAKLYKTGNSPVFSIANLVGTVTSPSGSFSFTTADTLINDTNYYWLTYDVSSTAANNNVLDAVFDSANVYGTWVTPITSNPTGNIIIAAPMTYIGSSVIHTDLSMVERPSTNNRMLRAMVRMSSTGAPVAITQFSLDANGGGDDTSNIANVKIFYTGNSANFSSTNQFGSTFVQTTPTGNKYGAFNINGILNLANDTNYFWVTYDIKSTAILGDSVDAELTAITIAGVSQTPATTAPAGNRKIRAQYCPSNATSAFDEEIWNVTIGSLNNTSTCATTAPGPGSVNSQYSNYSGFVAAPNLAAGLPIPFSVNAASCNGNYGSSLGIYIDYNQNGIFDLPGEAAYLNNSFTSSNTGATIISGNITVPCTALPGITRMRVVLIETTGGTTPCGTYAWGETEDYDVNIVSGSPSFRSVSANQNTGSTAASATDVRILRIPVVMTSSPCNPAIIDGFSFNTAGSTSASDIANAKLYVTRNSGVFNNTNLIGTVTSPSGQFTFTVADTLNNDTNFYWLTYDVSATATNSNVLDARLDSINVLGNWQVPANGNPAGNVVIATPMTYVGSSAIHPEQGIVETGAVNQRMLRVMVRMSSTGAPVALTQFSLDANGGGDDTSNIANVKVFATGNSPVFSATNQFGTTFVQTTPTGNKWGAFNINGTINLNNDTNYFWVTYNIKSTAIIGDSVDAEITGLTIAGVSQTPTNTAPTGSRRIRGPYCASAAQFAGDGEIWNVTVGSLNNTSNCTVAATGPGSSLSLYSNYTQAIAPANLVAGVSIPFSIHTSTCGGNYNGVLGIWIDLNQDGDFTDAGETVHMSPSFLYGTTVFRTGNFVIPCTATPGTTVMRVILNETTVSPISPCGSYFYGETEDYIVNIVNANPVYNGMTTVQQTGTTSAGATDVPVLRIPVRVTSSACTPGTVNEFRFNTAGTTTAANILTAKLYKTGNTGVFSNANLVASVTSPSGAFSFTVTDTLINDTNNYWLAYDVATTAANNNVLDATFDSANVYGNWVVPAASNPTGNVVIATPMTFVGSDVSHPDAGMVETGSTNNRMLRIRVRMSSTGAPVSLTQLNLNTNGGGNDTSNINNVKVFYTGTSATYATTNQFGSTFVQTTPTGASWGAFNINGLVSLANDTNYFWVTYDIKGTAIVGDSVDAELTGMTIGGVSQTPSNTAPAGNRKIRVPYCTSAAQFAGDGEILNVTVGTLNNTSNCTTAATGAGSTLSLYANYSETVTAPMVNAGELVAYDIHTATCGGNYNGVMGIWIDFNQDGDFTDAGETVVMTQSFLYGNGVYQTGGFYIPLTATPGRTRMRVILNETTASPISPCGTYFYGETEDYTIEILPATNNTYVWTQTGGGNLAVPTNWAPLRLKANLNDKLVINTGNAATFSGAGSQIVRAIEIGNNTIATVTANAATVVATDSITLGNNARVVTNNNIFVLGQDTTKIGALQLGTSAGIAGNFRRWFNAATPIVNFPLQTATGVNRSVLVDYNTLPSNIGSLTASFVTTAPGNTGLPLYDSTAMFTINRAGIDGYWSVVPSNGTSGGNFDISLNATGFTGVANFAQLVALRRNTSTSPWVSNGTHVAGTGSNAAPIVNRANLDLYGDFAVGADTSVNPLPVEMLSFTAKAINGNAFLNWSTSMEINNKGFFVEKSIDGVNFKDINFVAGFGNSKSVRNYRLEDQNAFALASSVYYRLRQVDFDGAETLSNVISLSENDLVSDEVSMYPNPFAESTGINFVSSVSGNATVEVIDIQGRLISSDKLSIKEGSQYVPLNNADKLNSGVYMVRVNFNGITQTFKIQKM
jgi:hypothetical protein